MNVPRNFVRLAIILAILACSNVKGSIIISLDQTGANLGLNVDEPRVWNFSVSQNIDVSLARFAMKNGNSTTEPVVFELFDNLGATGDLIASSTLDPSAFSSSAYVSEDFSFTSQTLTPGNYSAKLSSTAPASPNNVTYFMKAGRITLYEADGVTELGSEYYTPDSTTDGSASTDPVVSASSAVPEPSTALALSLMMLLTFFGRRKRAVG